MSKLLTVRALLALSFAAATPALPAGAPSYDGVWTVEGTTDVGPCEKAFKGEFRIEHNDLVSASGELREAIGTIDASGTGWARFTSEAGQARANGHFKGANATGAWSSNTAYCGGRWKAHRGG